MTLALQSVCLGTCNSKADVFGAACTVSLPPTCSEQQDIAPLPSAQTPLSPHQARHLHGMQHLLPHPPDLKEAPSTPLLMPPAACCG